MMSYMYSPAMESALRRVRLAMTHPSAAQTLDEVIAAEAKRTGYMQDEIRRAYVLRYGPCLNFTK